MTAEEELREPLRLVDLDNVSQASRHHVIVALDDEQLAAVEGWRIAQGIAEQPDALSTLVRIGLLSEIAKIYRLIADNRAPDAATPKRIKPSLKGQERRSIGDL